MSNLLDRLKKIKNHEYIILSIIIFFGLIIRLYKVDSPVADWHSWRQADTASVTRSFVEEGIEPLFPRYHDISTAQTSYFNPDGLRMVEFPLFNILHAYLVYLFPGLSLESLGRLLSIVSSLITAFFIFLIGRRFINVYGGLLASFFFTFIPYNVYFSRVILPEPLAVTLGVISLWLFIVFIKNERNIYLYFSAIMFALSILVKPFTIFYGLPILYLALRKFGFYGIFKNFKLLIALDIALAPLFLWRIWINNYPVGIPHWKWAFNGDKIRFRPSFWRWIFGERLGNLILGTWGIVPLSYGIITLKKNAFLLYFLLGMVLYVFVFATSNVRHDYYQIITIPVIALTVSSGSIFLWSNKPFDRSISRFLLIFSIALMFLIGASQVKEFYKINNPSIIEAGERVSKVTPKDSLVIAPYNGDTAFLYQTRRWGWPVVDRPLDELIELGADYYVSVNLTDPQTQEVIRRFKTVEKTENYLISDLNDPI